MFVPLAAAAGSRVTRPAVAIAVGRGRPSRPDIGVNHAVSGLATARKYCKNGGMGRASSWAGSAGDVSECGDALPLRVGMRSVRYSTPRISVAQKRITVPRQNGSVEPNQGMVKGGRTGVDDRPPLARVGSSGGGSAPVAAVLACARNMLARLARAPRAATIVP